MICFRSTAQSTAQKGREYSNWMDLTLNSHFEAVISETYRTEISVFSSKSTFFVKKHIQTGTKRSCGPNTDVFGKTQRRGGRADFKNARAENI